MLEMSRKRKLKREKVASKRRKRLEIKQKPASAKGPAGNPHTKQIKKDLLKTLALSVLAIGIVLVLYWGWI
jgi:hypothetical protein